MAREDQRELNNLPKMNEEQGQGRMLVIQEAKATRFLASELMKIAKDLLAGK